MKRTWIALFTLVGIAGPAYAEGEIFPDLPSDGSYYYVRAWEYPSWKVVAQKGFWGNDAEARKITVAKEGWHLIQKWRWTGQWNYLGYSWAWAFPPIHDLEISWASVDRIGDRLHAGDSAIFNVFLRNWHGTSPASVLHIRVQSPDGTRNYTIGAPALGLWGSYFFRVRLPDPWKRGAHTVTLTAGATGSPPRVRAGDTNPANNVATLTARVYSRTPLAEKFDVAVSDLRIAAVPSIGGQVTATARVRCVSGEIGEEQVKLALYGGNPSAAYRHALANEPSRILRESTLPALKAGDTAEISFRFAAADRFYNLHAVVEGHGGLDSGAANDVSNGVRFRPRGGDDVHLVACHVIYRNVGPIRGQPGRYMSDHQIERAKQAVRDLAAELWERTLCIRLHITDTVVINRMVSESEFQVSGGYFWGYNMGVKPAENDLFWNHGIDMTGFWAGKKTHSVYIVQNPFNLPEPPDKTNQKNFLYGMGWWEKAWQGGYLFQWTYLPEGDVTPRIVPTIVHEMMHGLEINLKRDGLHPSFPLTHQDWEDGRFGAIGGVDYHAWTLETTPTAWWRDLGARTRLVWNDSVRY